MLTGIFTTEQGVIHQGYAYLKGFALETIVTAVLFSMIGYFNGHDKTVWVMVQGLVQTLIVRLPLSYYMSIQPNASLTQIGLAAPIATITGIILNVCFYFYTNKKMKWLDSRNAVFFSIMELYRGGAYMEWESYFYKRILERGYDYYLDGCVEDLRITSNRLKQ